MKLNNKNRAAFFDLDLTITDRDSFRLFLKVYYFKNRSNWRYLPYVFFFGLLRKLRLISLQRFKEAALIGLKGKSVADIRQSGMDFFKDHLISVLRPKAVRRIERHQKAGDLVFIVSASPDIYVHAVSRFLDCDGYACSDLATGKGRFTGRLKGLDCIGGEKKRRLGHLSKKHAIDLNRSFAYSDHEADLPFIEAVGAKTVVSPTAKLRGIAGDRDWEIEDR